MFQLHQISVLWGGNNNPENFWLILIKVKGTWSAVILSVLDDRF